MGCVSFSMHAAQAKLNVGKSILGFRHAGLLGFPPTPSRAPPSSAEATHWVSFSPRPFKSIVTRAPHLNSLFPLDASGVTPSSAVLPLQSRRTQRLRTPPGISLPLVRPSGFDQCSQRHTSLEQTPQTQTPRHQRGRGARGDPQPGNPENRGRTLGPLRNWPTSPIKETTTLGGLRAHMAAAPARLPPCHLPLDHSIPSNAQAIATSSTGGPPSCKRSSPARPTL